MSQTPDVWLVRHGETAWSQVRKHTGRSDLPLTAAGERAAALLTDRLAGVHFDLRLVSPLERARRTAELAGVTGVTIEPRAVEWDYGELEGLTTEEIRRARPGWTVWEGEIPGGESIDDVAARAAQVVARVRREAAERALLVAHGHFLRILALTWLGLDPRWGGRFRLGTSTVSVLGWDRGAPILETWNS